MDFTPPAGPPPPRVPEGWKAQWNDQYKEWFYVNLHTKQSQWEKPTEPAYGSDGGPPPGPPPPRYDQDASKTTGPEKGGYLNSNNPYGPSSGHSSSHNISEDEAYARKLQEEENARVAANSSRGAADSYYGAGPSASPAPQYGQGSPAPQQPELPDRDNKSRGFMGKLFGKSSSARPQQGYGYGQQQYQQGPPQGQYGYAPQQASYGQYGQGGYAPQPMYQQQPVKKKHGLGTGGAAALGIGGGLLGGMLLADAVEDHDQNEYDQGYDQGYDDGDYGGGDF